MTKPPNEVCFLAVGKQNISQIFGQKLYSPFQIPKELESEVASHIVNTDVFEAAQMALVNFVRKIIAAYHHRNKFLPFQAYIRPYRCV